MVRESTSQHHLAVLAGTWMAIAYVIAGALLCLTIIGIPLGIASFKIAGTLSSRSARMSPRSGGLAHPPPGAVIVRDSR